MILDVVVLAGGRGLRLGGVSKADLTVGGTRLLDHILGDLATLKFPGGVRLGRIVVVAPDTVAVPAGVQRTLEDPPGGGPAAGIAAGVATLGEGDLVAVLTCDAPRSARALPLLLGALGDDGAAARGNVTEYLLAVYRFDRLVERIREQGGARDISARRLLGPLALRPVDVGDLARDVDTWEDLTGFGGPRPRSRTGERGGAARGVGPGR